MLYVFYVVYRYKDALIVPCTTMALALRERNEYVARHWAEQFPDQELPSDPEEAWRRYAEVCSEYEIGIQETAVVVD